MPSSNFAGLDRCLHPLPATRHINVRRKFRSAWHTRKVAVGGSGSNPVQHLQLGCPKPEGKSKIGHVWCPVFGLTLQGFTMLQTETRVPGVGRRSSSIRMKIMSSTPEWLHTKLDQSKICLLDFASRLNWKNGNDNLSNYPTSPRDVP